MIYLRDDDVIVRSGSYRSEFERFARVHRWTLEAEGSLLHVPTIVVEGTPGSAGLQDYPECIEYIRGETEAGRMAPELHGMFHIDYAAESAETVVQHLEEGSEWMEKNLSRRPRFWYTPWGADNELLRELAKQCGLELRGVNRKLMLPAVTGKLRSGELEIEELDDREVMMHWWEGGKRVLRLAKSIAHGSWEKAAQADPELFNG